MDEKKIFNIGAIITGVMAMVSFWLPYMVMSFGAKLFGLNPEWTYWPTYFWVIYMVGSVAVFVLTYFRVIVDELFIKNIFFPITLIVVNIGCVLLSQLISTPTFMIIISFCYPVIYWICSYLYLKNKNKEDLP